MTVESCHFLSNVPVPKVAPGTCRYSVSIRLVNEWQKETTQALYPL